MIPLSESTQITTVPPLPRPPHDPLTLRLDGRVGWREALLENTEVQPATNSLALKPVAGVGPDVAEPSGSFGGAVAPAVVAIGPRGAIYLLDREKAILLVFDPCNCRFEPVPCLGGIGSGARQFQDPTAIAICNGNLFVADSGNKRVSVFSLEGFLLRDHWHAPKKELFGAYSLAIDGRGRLFVSDPVNVRIHIFSPAGIWEESIPAPGVPRHLAIDCEDRIYVLLDGETSVSVIDADGNVVETTNRADAVAEKFPCLPFVVQKGGVLDLSRSCDSRAVFDLHGNRLVSPEAPASFAYPVPVSPATYSGRYWSEAFDSGFFNCQWHRIVACGCVPTGSSVRFATFTASALFTQADIEALPDSAWQTNQVMRSVDPGDWDCLIRSTEGRYLWLRIDFVSNGSVTPALVNLRIEFPRISLSRYLPAVFVETARSADFTNRFLAIFDTTFRSVELEIDRQAGLYDPASSPTNADRSRIDFLSYIASWIGLELNRNLPEQLRRDMVSAAAKIYPVRGTPEGLREMLLVYLGLVRECCRGGAVKTRCGERPSNCAPDTSCCAWEPPRLILEHFQLRRWMFLGQGRLGQDAQVWGASIVNRTQLNGNARADVTRLIMTQDPYRDPFHVYAHKFSVFVPAASVKNDAVRRGLTQLLNDEKPAHTQYQLELVEPRFRIGVQSTIGLNSVIGRYPAGVTLGESLLGKATVLEEAPHRRGNPAFEIGRNSRIGSTTALE